MLGSRKRDVPSPRFAWSRWLLAPTQSFSEKANITLLCRLGQGVAGEASNDDKAPSMPVFALFAWLISRIFFQSTNNIFLSQ